jgi:hypothetical protein
MEGLAFIIIVFGGAMTIALSKTEIGRALADRIRHGPEGVPGSADPALLEEVERLRLEVAELHERVDFTERMLATRRESDALPGGGA